MRKQIAAANWKMNLTYQDAENLLSELTGTGIELSDNQQVILAVPAPYLQLAKSKVANTSSIIVAAQNVYSKKSGAYTGEVSVLMLNSLNIGHVLIGHSERREYFNEGNELLAEKVTICLEHHITPVFCCGEPLNIRESGRQNEFVSKQLQESLFHLSGDEIKKVVIAYEPVWAIGTGKNATNDQVQEMHAHIRSIIQEKYGPTVADIIPILYGGSVKAENAESIFNKPDVDGGLVGGASLNAKEFKGIIKALK